MDYVERFTGRGPVSFEGLLKFTDISPATQRHLQQVYVTLAAAVGIAAVGAAVNLYTGLGGLLAMLGFMVCVPWLLSVPAAPATLGKRRALLAGAAFSQGALLGPLVNVALVVNPGTLVIALLGTTLVFACFSGAALFSRRRGFLYLGGLLSSAVSTLLLMRLATWFLGGRALLFEAELYLGLLIFSGYTIYDTQVIVERSEASPGQADPLRDALTLFVDLAAVFVRVLVILLRNAEKRQQRNEREQRDRSKRRRY